MQIDVVAPQVCNLTLSKELHRTSCRTSGLVGLWSCGLVNLHPAPAFLAECTASQPRQCKLQGVCLFDRILNPSLTALADFSLRAWIAVAGSVEGSDNLSRTMRAGQALRLARPPMLHRAFCKLKAGLGFASGNLAPTRYPPQLLSLPIAGKGVTTFRGYPSESGFPA